MEKEDEEMTGDVMCIECEDTQAALECINCQDVYCQLCYQAQHRKGTRSKHEIKIFDPPKIEEKTIKEIKEEEIPNESIKTENKFAFTENVLKEEEEEDKVEKIEIKIKMDEMIPETDEETPIEGEESNQSPWVSRSKYIPMRLSEEERDLLILLDASLSVSEYTDQVDVLSYRSSLQKRIISQLKEILSIMSGMTIANHFQKGKRLIKGKKFYENAEYIQKIFEIGRRYKIMNPEKMRDNYGKMLYLLQDSVKREVQKSLNFSCICPIVTVYSTLKNANGLNLLNDPLLSIATQPIQQKKMQTESISNYVETIQSQKQKKQQALEQLVEKYASETLSPQLIEHCLVSIADSSSYLESNTGPIDQMLHFLHTFFDSSKIESSQFSLAIQAGRNGARLTHSHTVQFHYVKQSLCLWRNITNSMYKLWLIAENDLLSTTNGYRLRDTGQGLNRMQRAPSTSRFLHNILSQTQHQTTSEDSHKHWIGSSVIHLGDHNVPNALMLIDKYTQISRILSPVVKTIEYIEDQMTNTQMNNGFQTYVSKTFGTKEKLQKLILNDFFKHGFDGSGAENFFDAGSCIDGRLTSAWNWCSKIEKKKFYHVFLMCGFVGFDGSFEK